MERRDGKSGVFSWVLGVDWCSLLQLSRFMILEQTICKRVNGHKSNRRDDNAESKGFHLPRRSISDLKVTILGGEKNIWRMSCMHGSWPGVHLQTDTVSSALSCGLGWVSYCKQLSSCKLNPGLQRLGICRSDNPLQPSIFLIQLIEWFACGICLLSVCAHSVVHFREKACW